MIRRPPRSTPLYSSAASDVYKRQELGKHGIHVNAIAPGGIQTEGTSKPLEGSKLTGEQMKKMMDDFTKRIPLGRMGIPDDIAKVAVFLASSYSDYITGETIIVDGGMLLS